MLRFWAILLVTWLPIQAAAAGDPAVLQIRIVEGEDAAYALGSRSTRGVTVEVTDESGRPVEGATVSFRLPEEGPGGAFANGSKTEIATSRPDGRAGVWGMQWNRTAGSFELRITAAKGQARAGTVCGLSLSDAVEDRGAARAGSAGHGGHKWLWIALGTAAAAGIGGAAAARGTFASTSAAQTVTHIGVPSIIIGHP